MSKNNQNQLPLEQLRQIRIDKAKKLRKLGIDPYPSNSNRTHKVGDILADYKNFAGKEVTVAGRLMSTRGHGGLIFGDLQEETGKIQLYIKKDSLKNTDKKTQTIGFEDIGLLDIGDIIEAKGEITKTKSGEVSVLVKELRILTKSIRPLPDKHEGLKDQGLIHRKRYLDHIINPENRYRFIKGAEIKMAIRQFMTSKGFLEIKTPIIQPVHGGTSAKPFITKVNALDVDYSLAVSHELYLKRLIAAGFENVFNIVGYFRNEGIDRTHNPEFEMLETMTAFHNYEYNMELLEELYSYIANNVFEKTVYKIKGHDVDITKPWKRIMMVDAVKKYTKFDFGSMKSIKEAHKTLKSLGVEERPNSIGESMAFAFESKVEEKLIEPTIIYGHPIEISPLAKSMKDDPRYVERFEVFIGGMETGDHWSELNDPVELFERFKEQAKRRKGGDLEAHRMDLDFIEAMEYGMAPTTGLGPGIERLIMLFTEAEYIDDVIYFPLMKPREITPFDKKVYGVSGVK